MSEKKPFDRAEHCRRIAVAGGRATYRKHGSSHYSAIGSKGWQAFAARFRSPAEARHYLASMGAHVYWKATGYPDTGKFPAAPPVAPWEEGYTEF